MLTAARSIKCPAAQSAGATPPARFETELSRTERCCECPKNNADQKQRTIRKNSVRSGTNSIVPNGFAANERHGGKARHCGERSRDAERIIGHGERRPAQYRRTHQHDLGRFVGVVRIIATPRRDMAPGRSRSPDWSREGVNPNTAPTDLDLRKRAGTSAVAR